MTITNPTTGSTITLAVLRIDYSNEARATEHTVEGGAVFTDHVEKLPPRFTADLLVSESSRDPLQPGGAAAVEAARLFLELNLGEVCNLTIPGEGAFLNYAIEGVRHSYTNVRGRVYTVRFKLTRIAQSLSVVIPARQPLPAVADGMASPQSAGQQATTPAPTSTFALIDEFFTGG